MSGDGVEVVRGGAAPEELAAVVAVLLALGESGDEEEQVTGYAAWRRTRLAAIARGE
jgi:Acyl-CoA carboxylase epsilon subunit